VDRKYYSIINFYKEINEPVAVYEKDNLLWVNKSYSEYFNEPVFSKTLNNLKGIQKSSLKHGNYKVEIYQTPEENKSLASLTHEFRSPLNIIMGIVEVFKETPLNDDQEKYISALTNSSKTLMDLINRFLDLNKLHQNKLELYPSEVDLDNFIGEIVSTHALSSYKKNNEISYLVSNNIQNKFLIDELRLKQVITNILNNSIKFTENGKIHIEVEVKDKNLEIMVEDTGIGIEKNKIDKVFNSYQQASCKISKNYGGTGLGLAISKEIVDLMSGEITVKSVAGEGAAFIIQIPLKFTDSKVNRLKLNKNLIYITDDYYIKSFINNMENESISDHLILSLSELKKTCSFSPEKNLLFCWGKRMIKTLSVWNIYLEEIFQQVILG